MHISNLDAKGEIIPPTDRAMRYIAGNQLWHSDSSYKRFPAKASLLRKLTNASTIEENVYGHRWEPGDLIMWDNRCCLHRGRPWNSAVHRRVMHRTTVAGDGPTVG